ncbi:MAG: hypothetical protein MOGMAGMI_00042 [Candidatus Omnitrophica bacterium]|nr:hypothetical protein [Candidatus Omnitrophota bacterium]
MRALRTLTFYLLLTAALTAGGGWLVLVLADGEPVNAHAAQGLVALGAAVAAALMARSIVRGGAEREKELWFGLSAYVLLGAMVLGACEVAAATRAVPWPAIGLHGVEPEAGRKAWHRSARAERGPVLNSWGQKDHERSRIAPPGRTRVAFVGDSFLEEGVQAPVSVRTEELAGDPYEVINLGVSATGPDEYYYRVKNIALRLDTEVVFCFFYTGNDFVEAGNLKTWWGLAAVYPRDSLLSKLGLIRINHLLTNRERPLLRAWGRAGELNKTEESRRAIVLRAPDEGLRRFLLFFVQPQNRLRLYAILRRPGVEAFFQMLRRPDEGMFRTYILERALRVAAGEWPVTPIDEAPAYRPMKRAYELCRARQKGFVLVIVPEGFAVDPRLRAQWSPVADLKGSFRPNREAAARLAEKARADGIPVIDLHELFDGKPGTYLNLDGHWSPAGSELAAQALAQYIRRSVRAA